MPFNVCSWHSRDSPATSPVPALDRGASDFLLPGRDARGQQKPCVRHGARDLDVDDDRARHATQAWKMRPEAKEPVSANAM